MQSLPRSWRVLALSSALGCAAAACAVEGSGSDVGTGSTGMETLPPVSDGTGDEIQVAPVAGCNKMDVLFVIDNSSSMTEEQANLSENFPRFIEVLEEFRDGAVDYRVAVTTTGLDLGDLPFGPPIEIPGENGALVQQTTCGMTQPWLERGDPGLLSCYACNATVGVSGSSNEMPLLAARLALTERIVDGTNLGFLRDDALLAIVIVTDEDDHSIDPDRGATELNADIPVSAFIADFDDLKGDPGRWAAAVIAGDKQPSCDSAFGTATNALKLRSFVDMVGENAVFSSICEGDLATGLSDAIQTFALACDAFPII